MKKNIFTLLALLVCAVGSAWGDVTLFSTDFTNTTTWPNTTVFSQGNTNTADVINGITFYGKNSSSSKNFSLSAGTCLNWPDNNINSSNYFLAIPIENIQGGTVKISVSWVAVSGKTPGLGYVVKDGETSVSTPGTTSTVSGTSGGNLTEVTVSGLTNINKKAVVYLGRGNSNVKTITSITITTPTLYNVTYKAGKGSGSDVVKQTVAADASTFTAPAGKVFWKWTTNEDGSGTSYYVGDAITEDLTLYAQYATEIFSMTGVTAPTDKVTKSTSSDITATFNTGSSAIVYNGKGDDIAMVDASYAIDLSGSSNSYFCATFTRALQEGDVIICSGGTSFKISATSSSPTAVTFPYTIPAEHALIGKTSVYVFKNSDSRFTSFTILRSKIATSEALKASAAVKVGDTPLTKDAAENGYAVSSTTITLSNNLTFISAPTDITLVKTITYDDASTKDEEVDVTFDGTITDGYYIGTASIGLSGSETNYTVRAKKNTSPAIALTEDSGIITLKSFETTKEIKVSLVGSNLTNGTFSVEANRTGTTISPTTFTIAGGEVDQEFTITTSASSAATTEFTFGEAAMGIAAPVYTLTVSKTAQRSLAQSTVSATTTWDFTQVGTSEIRLNDTTDPNKTDEFLMGNLAEVNNNATFNSQALNLRATEFVVRDTKYMQGTEVSFNTTVPGTVQVWFSNTGGSRPYRYLYVNGLTNSKSNTGAGKLADAVESSEITVPAGNIVIKGVLDPDAATNFNGYNESSHGAAGGDQFLRIFKIVFTADNTLSQQAITISCEGGYASYSCDKALDFTGSNAKAYIIKATSESSATLTEVTKVPANTGIIVAGTKGETVNVLTTDGATDDVTGNLLKGTVNTPVAVDADKAYGLSKTDGKFHLLNAGTIPANKAYLLASEVFQASGAAVLDLDFGETTGINMVNGSEFMVNGSDFYNLNGQRVAQPTKGLYIVNGRKVIIK